MNQSTKNSWFCSVKKTISFFPAGWLIPDQSHRMGRSLWPKRQSHSIILSRTCTTRYLAPLLFSFIFSLINTTSDDNLKMAPFSGRRPKTLLEHSEPSAPRNSSSSRRSSLTKIIQFSLKIIQSPFSFYQDGRRPFELFYHGQFDDSRPRNGIPVTGR